MDAGNQPMARNTQRPRRTANNHSSKVAYRKGRIMSITPKQLEEIYRLAMRAKLKLMEDKTARVGPQRATPSSPAKIQAETNQLTKKEKLC